MIRLLSLTIKAFRGVSEELVVDLSSPITLIYAPNGTGKTTICDAVEWLLTGQVKRYDAVLTIEQLRCQFSEDAAQTLVSGCMLLNGESLELERSFSDCRWKLGARAWSKVSPSDLLEKIAPSAAEEGVHKNHANNSRQIWLKGTRFLAGETLATLLDSDGDAIDGRQKIFADMLGVGHLLETERQLRGYLEEIGHSLRAQQGKVNDLLSLIRDRETRIAKETVQPRERMLDHALGAFNQACQLIGFSELQAKEASPQNLLSSIAIVRTDLEGREFKREEKQKAEINVRAEWQNRERLKAAAQEDSERTNAIIFEFSNVGNRLVDIGSEHERLASQLTTLRTELSRTESLDRGLGAAQSQAQPILEYFLALQKIEKLTWADTASILDIPKRDSLVALGSAKLHDLSRALPEYDVRRVEILEQKNRRDAISLRAPTSDSMANLSKASETQKENLEDLRDQLDLVAAPLEQIRELADRVLDHLRNEHECPLCGSDWNTVEELRAAIASTVSGTPASITQAQGKIRELEGAAEQTRLSIVSGSRVLAELAKANEEIRVAEIAIEAYETKLRDSGISPGDTNIASKIENAIAICRMIPALRNLRAATEQALKGIQLQLALDVNVSEIYATLAPRLTDEIRALTLQIESAERKMQAVQNERTAVTHQRQKLEAENDVITRRLKMTTHRLQALRSAWQILGGDANSMDDDALAAISDSLRKEREISRLVTQHLREAEGLLLELANVRELEALREKLEPIAIERDRLARYSDAATELKDSYERYRKNHTQTQMATFVEVISALFTRMQCNLVYDGIKSGDESAPLTWLAMAEESRINPEGLFSQGQRQDFALSIFLAHARGLGGSFILDEPMSHLDDLNKVALLDVFRALTVEQGSNLSFVITSANKQLVRHMAEKFSRVKMRGSSESDVSLNVISLEGNPRTGVSYIKPEFNTAH